MGNKLVEIYKVNKSFGYKTLVKSLLAPINEREDRAKLIDEIPWDVYYLNSEYIDFTYGTTNTLEGDILDADGFEFDFEIIIQKPEVEVLHNYSSYEPEELDESDELVIVPKFVDRWIKSNQQDECEYASVEDAEADSIHYAIYGLYANYPNTNPDVHIRKPVLEWLNNRENYSVLFKALMFGYVLEETKYYAQFKSWDNTFDKRLFWCYSDIISERYLTDEKYPFSNDIFKTMKEWAKIGVNEDNAEFMEEK